MKLSHKLLFEGEIEMCNRIAFFRVSWKIAGAIFDILDVWYLFRFHFALTISYIKELIKIYTVIAAF